MHAPDLVPPRFDDTADGRPKEVRDDRPARAGREDQVPAAERPDFLTMLLRALAVWGT